MARICVGWVKALVVLDIDDGIMSDRFSEEILMVRKKLNRRFGEENMNALSDGVKGDRVMRCVGREDANSVAWVEGVDGGFVSVRITDCGIGGERIKRDIEVVVD